MAVDENCIVFASTVNGLSTASRSNGKMKSRASEQEKGKVSPSKEYTAVVEEASGLVDIGENANEVEKILESWMRANIGSIRSQGPRFRRAFRKVAALAVS